MRVFEWSGSAWTQLGTDIDGNTSDFFGSSVSISADGTLFAASSSDGSSGGDSNGYVRVFHWYDSNWTQLGASIDGKATYDRIHSVSLSDIGNRVAFGAWGVDGNRGQARVYQYSGVDWVQLGDVLEGEARGDEFGNAVSLSSDGTRLAVGAYKNDEGDLYAGKVQVFYWTGSTWAQLGADIIEDTREGFFGNSVSLSDEGDRLAISALSSTGSGDYTGFVRVYHWSGSAWQQIGSDLFGEAANDSFGKQVALSANGNRLAVGADQNDANGDRSGHVRVFSLSEFNVFQINPGLNDHWYNPLTDGQGYYITVFPDLGKVNLTGFTWDTEHPPQGATAHFGNPGHRWFNALGNYADDQAVMNIKVASGGLFDTPVDQAPVERVRDGTIILTFDGCNSGLIEYDIPSIDRTGTVPIERIVGDNIAICEAFAAGESPW